MLSSDGIEKGTIKRIITTAHKTEKVFLGRRSSVNTRTKRIATIIKAADRLICNKFMQSPAFLRQVLFFKTADNFFQIFNLFCAQFFSAEQSGEQLIGRAVIDFVNQFVGLLLLYFLLCY